MANVKKKSGKKRRRARASLPAKILILTLLVAIGWQLHSLNGQLESAQAEKERLAAQVEAKTQENDILAADIAQGTTPEKMQEIAREELGWIAPGEYVFYNRNN